MTNSRSVSMGSAQPLQPSHKPLRLFYSFLNGKRVATQTVGLLAWDTKLARLQKFSNRKIPRREGLRAISSQRLTLLRLKWVRSFYKNFVRPILFTSRLGRRTILGHVGRGLFVDYIYENKASGYMWIGKFVDKVLLTLPAAQATRHKMEKISELLEEEIARNMKMSKATKIVDLGSGTARYLVRLAREKGVSGEKLQAICLDIDKASLRMGRRISQGLPVEYRIGDVTDLGRYSRLSERTGWKPNLVIVSTCYDLLDDSVTRKSLEEIYYSIEPGGAIIVVSQIRNPSEKLIKRVRLPEFTRSRIYYRDPFVVKKWMRESGYKDIRIGVDKWNMYCFYVGRRIGNGALKNETDIPIFLKGRMYKRVAKMRSNDAYQYMRGFEPLPNGRGLRGGQKVILMATNDYLGLRSHPKMVEAAIAATRRYGVSTASSRILAGNLEIYEELQSRLSSFLGFEDTLVFSSGYGANVGVMSSLVGQDDVALVDRNAHASLLDGCKLSGGQARFFAHNNCENLEKLLQEQKDIKGKVIVCDGVYSMDGDLAPLPELFQIARKHSAGLAIDDGHATGVFGEGGRGTLEYFNISNKEQCVLIGSLGKALGSNGGFVAGTREVIDFLRHTARPLLFSTGLTPASAAAAMTALELIIQEPELIQQLWANTRKMREGLSEMGYNVGVGLSPLIPIIVGDEYTVYKIVVALEETGVAIDGVGPPAVKQNQCRLRIRMMATHTERDIEIALDRLKRMGKKFGVI